MISPKKGGHLHLPMPRNKSSPVSQCSFSVEMRSMSLQCFGAMLYSPIIQSSHLKPSPYSTEQRVTLCIPVLVNFPGWNAQTLDKKQFKGGRISLGFEDMLCLMEEKGDMMASDSWVTGVGNLFFSYFSAGSRK